VISPHGQSGITLASDLDRSAAHISQPAHTDLCQCNPSLNAAGGVDAGVDDPGSTRQPEAVDAQDIGLIGHRIGDFTRRFVHSE
jgi:hypothetical protein